MSFVKKVTEKLGLGRKENREEEQVRKVEVEEVNWDEIVCPYCFEKFSHRQAHFRSVTVKNNIVSEEVIEEKYGDNEDLLAQKMEENRIERKFMRQKRDEKLEQFWNKFGVQPEQRQDKEWSNPVIVPEDKEMLYRGSDEGLIFTSEGEEEGFLVRVKDRFMGVSTTRLCPHCHNRLPSTYENIE